MVNSQMLSPPKIRSRQISDSDVDAVAELLTRGFRIRSSTYWRRALAKLGSRPAPEGLPKYGYLLESGGVPVGVILLIFSSVPASDAVTTRCNVSSWYVEPEFRSHAALLISQAIKHKNVTYVNISPAMHTRPIVEAQGFARYTNGQFAALPALSGGRGDDTARVVGIDTSADARFGSCERELLSTHRDYGCLGLWCVTSERAHPFVFMPRRVKGFIPCVQLIYCRDIQDFVRFARPIGRYLAKRGRPLVIVDSNGPIAGLVGIYLDGKSPKYFKGPRQPSFGDLAYTEAVMFGL
ncbi:MAG: hypothetical protein QOI40_4945 [Alphaproteobacteria bacterium]|jgi:hypothetical protein|nr:hypothetical protein [Alphaproteobacteria bacterium]